MPFSWVRVSRATSRKLRDCVDGDPSRVRFRECVERIIGDDGGRTEAVWFEQNGRWARVHFYWDTPDQKARIIFDLEGDEVIDLITPEEADAFDKSGS